MKWQISNIFTILQHTIKICEAYNNRDHILSNDPSLSRKIRILLSAGLSEDISKLAKVREKMHNFEEEVHFCLNFCTKKGKSYLFVFQSFQCDRGYLVLRVIFRLLHF
jgi:hypothetical protein